MERQLNRCKPRLGGDFVTIARAMLTNAVAADLRSLYGFSFRQHGTLHAEQERLDALAVIANEQIKRILR